MRAETRVEKNRLSSLISSGERQRIKLIRFIPTNFQDERVMLMKNLFDKTSNQSSLIFDKPREGNQFKRLPCFFFVVLLWFEIILQTNIQRRHRWNRSPNCSTPMGIRVSWPSTSLWRWVVYLGNTVIDDHYSCTFSSDSFTNVFLENEDVSNDIKRIVWRPDGNQLLSLNSFLCLCLSCWVRINGQNTESIFSLNNARTGTSACIPQDSLLSNMCSLSFSSNGFSINISLSLLDLSTDYSSD